MKEIQEGDPKYLAPEVLEGSQNITTAVDIFSLGMSILELATDLDLPRGGEPWHKLRNGQIPRDLTDSLSSQLVQIILTMIDSNYKRRATADFLLGDVHVKRQMAVQKRQEFFKKLVKKLKTSMGFFYTVVSRDLLRPLVFGCQFIVGGFGLINWISRKKELFINNWSFLFSSPRSYLNGNLKSHPPLAAGNNNTSTPHKTDPHAIDNTNLLEINNEEQDDECEWKIRKHLKKIRKYDQYDCKLHCIV